MKKIDNSSALTNDKDYWDKEPHMQIKVPVDLYLDSDMETIKRMLNVTLDNFKDSIAKAFLKIKSGNLPDGITIEDIRKEKYLITLSCPAD